MVIISREVEIIEGRKEERERESGVNFDKELINRSGIVQNQMMDQWKYWNCFVIT